MALTLLVLKHYGELHSIAINRSFAVVHILARQLKVMRVVGFDGAQASRCTCLILGRKVESNENCLTFRISLFDFSVSGATS